MFKTFILSLCIFLCACSSTVQGKVFGVTRTYGDSAGIARAKAEVYRRHNTVSPTMQWWYRQNVERQLHEQRLEYLRLLHKQRMEYLRAVQNQDVK